MPPVLSVHICIRFFTELIVTVTNLYFDSPLNNMRQATMFMEKTSILNQYISIQLFALNKHLEKNNMMEDVNHLSVFTDCK